jgi:hypothetical protein
MAKLSTTPYQMLLFSRFTGHFKQAINLKIKTKTFEEIAQKLKKICFFCHFFDL